MREYGCQGGAFEVPLQYKDKEVVQKDVDGRSDEQDE
jgi:hypothetical protein